MAAANDEEILEGFLCPICKADLKSASQLTSHFENLHQEDQDVLKSLKDIFGKAKKVILNAEDTNLKETFDRALKFNSQEYYPYEEQTIGVSRSASDYFKAVRSARLERYATETNKLLIRLDKLVCNMPSEPNLRKQHEQAVSNLFFYFFSRVMTRFIEWVQTYGASQASQSLENIYYLC